MNYEKKYKDLVKAVKELQEANPSDDGIQNWIKDNIPELKESKDEKIKTFLINFFKQYRADGWKCFTTDFKIDELIAWLEKQGEPFDVNIITRDDEILQAISIGLTDAKEDLGWSDFGGLPIEEIQDWLEKQGEHIDKVEPKYKIGDWLKTLKHRCAWKPNEKQINALDSTLQYGQVSSNFVEYLNSLFNDLKKLMEE